MDTLVRGLPSPQRLKILWHASIISRLETNQTAYEIFANLLYGYMTGKSPITGDEFPGIFDDDSDDAPWLDCMDGFSSLPEEN